MSNQSMVFKLTSNKKERFELCPSSFDPKYIIDWYDIQKILNNNKHFKFNHVKSTILSLGPKKRPTPSPKRSPSPRKRPTPRRSPSPRKSPRRSPSPKRRPTPRRSPSPRKSLKTTHKRSPSPRKSLKTTPKRSPSPRRSLNRKYSLLYPYGSPKGTPPPVYSFLYPHGSSKGKQPRASPRIQGSLYQDLLRHHKNAVEV